MSCRMTVRPRLPGLTVTVGWDNPLNTYFAQVAHDMTDATEDDAEVDPVLIWIGTRSGEISQPEELVDRLAAYATISEADLAVLRADRIVDLDRKPTTLQRMMLQHMAESERRTRTEPGK